MKNESDTPKNDLKERSFEFAKRIIFLCQKLEQKARSRPLQPIRCSAGFVVLQDPLFCGIRCSAWFVVLHDSLFHIER